MKFQAYFTPIIKIVLYAMAIASFVGLVIGLLAIAQIFTALTIAQGILLVSVAPICIVITLLLATIHYKVDESHLRLYIGFFDILSGRIRLDKILNIVIDNNKMYISYLHEGTDPIIAAIVINPKRYGAMKELLMAKNPNIVYYENEPKSDNSK